MAGTRWARPAGILKIHYDLVNAIQQFDLRQGRIALLCVGFREIGFMDLAGDEGHTLENVMNVLRI
jgi:hypothetical protein